MIFSLTDAYSDLSTVCSSLERRSINMVWGHSLLPSQDLRVHAGQRVHLMIRRVSGVCAGRNYAEIRDQGTLGSLSASVRLTVNQGQHPWAVEEYFSVLMGWLPLQASEELLSWGAWSRKPAMWLERGTWWALQKSCARAGSHSPDGGSVHRSWLALTRTAILLNARVRLSSALFGLVLRSNCYMLRPRSKALSVSRLWDGQRERTWGWTTAWFMRWKALDHEGQSVAIDLGSIGMRRDDC